MKTIYEIISDAGMSTSPSFYSGRGATTSDLNDRILEKIWSGIKENFSDEAAESFVSMVEQMEKLSATAFLNELFSLVNNDFKFNSIAGHDGFDFLKNEDGSYNEANAMASLFSAISSDRDDTPMIRNSFLMRHGRKIKHGDKVGRFGLFPY